jgi:ABC-type Fe3+-hydroxamate transport system substrate-binding protein
MSEAFENESLTDAKETLRGHPRVHWARADFADRLPARIVSLVPSLSEALVVLGLGNRLAGVTEYCVHPAGAFDELPKLGGTKDADVERIVGVEPDLVIANQEENTARVVRKLAEHDVDVWVTYPRTVRQGAELLAELATLGASAEATARHVAPVLAAVESAERTRDARFAAEATARSGRQAVDGATFAPRPKVFCPIWRDPWMTINHDTYIHDMIELCGGQNMYGAPVAPAGPSASSMAGVEGESGAARADRRYPIVDLDSVLAAQPDVILLPDEPYAFDGWDKRRLSRTDTPAGRAGRIHLIDGTLVSWYGPRIAEAIRALAAIFAIP